MILLDTNVISELMKPAPADRVAGWIAAQPSTSLYTTSVTQAEILYGVMLLPPGRKRNALEATAETMFREDFGGRADRRNCPIRRRRHRDSQRDGL